MLQLQLKVLGLTIALKLIPHYQSSITQVTITYIVCMFPKRNMLLFFTFFEGLDLSMLQLQVGSIVQK